MEKYACETHVNQVLDEVTASTGEFPILEKIETGENLSTRCEHCEQPAIYVVGGKN